MVRTDPCVRSARVTSTITDARAHPAIAIPNVEAFEAFLRPADSAEVLTQTAREASTMAVDLPDDDGPPSAGEPPLHTTQDPPSKTIPLCPSLDNDASVQSAIAHAQAAGPAPGQFAQPGDISSLLSQLSSAGFGAQFAGQQGQAALGQTMQNLGFLQPGAQPNYAVRLFSCLPTLQTQKCS